MTKQEAIEIVGRFESIAIYGDTCGNVAGRVVAQAAAIEAIAGAFHVDIRGKAFDPYQGLIVYGDGWPKSGRLWRFEDGYGHPIPADWFTPDVGMFGGAFEKVCGFYE